MISPEDSEEFHTWLSTGVQRGWCSEIACATHDGEPMTEEEAAAWDEGWDPCMFVVRIWD